MGVGPKIAVDGNSIIMQEHVLLIDAVNQGLLTKTEAKT